MRHKLVATKRLRLAMETEEEREATNPLSSQLPREVSVKPSQNIEPFIELFTGAESYGTRRRDVK